MGLTIYENWGCENYRNILNAIPCYLILFLTTDIYKDTSCDSFRNSDVFFTLSALYFPLPSSCVPPASPFTPAICSSLYTCMGDEHLSVWETNNEHVPSGQIGLKRYQSNARHILYECFLKPMILLTS